MYEFAKNNRNLFFVQHHHAGQVQIFEFPIEQIPSLGQFLSQFSTANVIFSL